MKGRLINIIGLAIALAFVTSCAKEVEKESGLFSISVSVDQTTKAAPVNDVDSFNASVASFPFKLYGSDLTDLLLSASATQVDGTWAVPPYAWPEGTSRELFALAASPSAGVELPDFYPCTYTSSEGIVYNGISFSYSADSKSAEAQPDLMAGHYEGTGVNGKAEVAFSHVMSAIRFKSVLSDVVKIKSVGFVNLYSEGSCTVIYDSQEPSVYWTQSRKQSDYEQEINASVSPSSEINPDSWTFMVMPQTVPDNAYAYVRVDRGGESSIQKIEIAGDQWQPGEIITYQIEPVRQTVIDKSKYDSVIASLTDAQRNSIESVEIKAPYTYVSGSASLECEIQAEGSGEKVYLALNGNTLAITSSASRIFAPSDCSDLFKNFSSLSAVSFQNFDTSSTKSLSGMFENCTSLTDFTFGGVSTANVEDFSKMFKGCTGLTSLALERVVTAKGNKYDEMIAGCPNIQTLDFGDTFVVIEGTFTNMLYGTCTNVTRPTLKMLSPLYLIVLVDPRSGFGLDIGDCSLYLYDN